MLPVEAYAGCLQQWSGGDVARLREGCISCPGVDFGIRITGDSMEPEFKDGSILFIKRINEKAFIPWGHPMVIDTENGVVVKVIYPAGDSVVLRTVQWNISRLAATILPIPVSDPHREHIRTLPRNHRHPAVFHHLKSIRT